MASRRFLYTQVHVTPPGAVGSWRYTGPASRASVPPARHTPAPLAVRFLTADNLYRVDQFIAVLAQRQLHLHDAQQRRLESIATAPPAPIRCKLDWRPIGSPYRSRGRFQPLPAIGSLATNAFLRRPGAHAAAREDRVQRRRGVVHRQRPRRPVDDERSGSRTCTSSRSLGRASSSSRTSAGAADCDAGHRWPLRLGRLWLSLSGTTRLATFSGSSRSSCSTSSAPTTRNILPTAFCCMSRTSRRRKTSRSSLAGDTSKLYADV